MRSGSKEEIMIKDRIGYTALHHASSHGHLEIVKLLIKKGNLQKEDIMTINNDGSTSLFLASYYGHLETVKLLIENYNLQKEDILMKNKFGTTALYWACKRGHLAIVKILIELCSKEDILLRISSIKNIYNGRSAYSVANPSIKQFFNNVFFNGAINDMIKDIMIEL